MRQYQRVPTKRFRRDLRALQRAGYDLHSLEQTIDILVSGKQLPNWLKDHGLKGQCAGCRECHVGPDWLLLYQKDHERLILFLLRTGTHAEIFGP